LIASNAPDTAAPMVEVHGLDKRFGALHVLRSLDLRLARGRITAIVGPNGSGKTTLIKILLGLVRPDAGTVAIDDAHVTEGWQYRERIGYMPQAARYPENLTPREVFAMLKDLRGVPDAIDEELIDAFHLHSELEKPLRTLSGGNRQKVGAVIAFLFRPDLVILDEPTAGLDPVASSTLKDKIRSEQERGTTFLITSHVMSELDVLADDVAVLLDGQIRYSGPIRDLKREAGEQHLERAIAHLMTKAD
jgi:Cu-processing system ATP-binding protein